MKLLVLLTLIALAKAKVTLQKNCDGVIIRNINYEKEVLKSGLGSPHQLAIDYNTNTLFFSYSVNIDEKSQSAYINLKNNEFGIIPGIVGGYANAVDDVSHNVYLGGREGIYKYDYNTKRAIDLRITNENIYQLFFNKELYFTNTNEEAYVYKDGKVIRVPELKETEVRLLAVDNNKNILFLNFTGLFSYRSENNNIIKIGSQASLYHPFGFTTDSNGNLYYSTLDHFCFVNDGYSKVEPIASLDDTLQIAVEKDGNFIYASSDSIIRLKPTGHTCISNKTVAA